MNKYVTCLTIAGSDSGGGAGIQADLKTMSAIGVYGMSAITAITAQSTTAVNDIYAISPKIVESQISTVLDDIECNTVKIGMIYLPENAEIIATTLSKYKIANIILDPVLISTTQFKLSKDDVVDTIKNKLLPICTLVTPNTDEVYEFTGIKIKNKDDVCLAAREFIKMGAKAVLIKGGHNIKSTFAYDYLLTNTGYEHWYRGKAIETNNLHGTGCSLSSAIASYLAQEYPLPQAIAKAKLYITKAISYGSDTIIGKGNGPINHFFLPKKLIKIKL